jgi:hypothetical protein
MLIADYRHSAVGSPFGAVIMAHRNQSFSTFSKIDNVQLLKKNSGQDAAIKNNCQIG